MRKEKILLSFFAVIVGLVAAGVAFYLYQMTKTVPTQKEKPTVMEAKTEPSPTPETGNLLSIESPKDEAVFDKKVIDIRGKTANDATIIISTEDGDQIVKPSKTGEFTLTQSIPDGTTIMKITAIYASGEEKSVTKTVTFSTDNY